MKLIKAIIRPTRLEEVRDALTALGVEGMTVTEVRGHGKQKGHKAIYRGTEYNVTLLPKTMVEVMVPDEQLTDTIKVIAQAAHTGEIGDGRIFVLPVEEAYNIRLGERQTHLELATL
jgi:nitrogen regulatory protein PII